jgi:SAM-dependent methyltransferase
MFSLGFLNQLRTHEFGKYLRYFSAGCSILEIGGGTGVQAKLLTEMGYRVESIDLESSNYASALEFPIKFYDGHTIPFPSQSFDVVFSSNVLEHIKHICEFQLEIRRVLRPGGYCIHAMPSTAWTFWTIVTHYLNIVEQIYRQIASLQKNDSLERALPSTAAFDGGRSKGFNSGSIGFAVARECISSFLQTLYSRRDRLLPKRHGEFGSVLTELITFSRFSWKRHFRSCGYEVVEATPMGLFYTGYMFFGSRWPLASREKWSRVLGSACILYRVRPKD